MPPTDSNAPFAFLGRSILSIRRNHVVSSVDSAQEQELQQLDLFQKHVADSLRRLSDDHDAGKSPILSFSWLHTLLDEFLSRLQEFKTLLVAASGRAPHDRLVSDLLDRAVKALDVCNAVSSGAESVCNWQKQAQIASLALDQKPLSEAQLRRAKKALASLVGSMDGSGETSRITERNWSFGRKPPGPVKERNSRSLSWNASQTWSAAKQVQAMGANLHPPRGAETNILALPMYTISALLVFVTWVLVAAVPCPDRGPAAGPFPLPPRQLIWAEPMIGLQEKITEEWRKREKGGGRSNSGLLRELQKLEESSNRILELGFENVEEVKSEGSELAEACRRLEEGLIPFHGRTREVFHRIIRSRREVVECLGEAGGSSSTTLL